MRVTEIYNMKKLMSYDYLRMSLKQKSSANFSSYFLKKNLWFLK